MNVGVSSNTLFIITLVIIFIFFLLLRLNNFRIRGARGEKRVARQLKKLRGEEYAILNDVLLRTSGGTSQIDHIVVSIKGIFVIETKNYAGWIHGSENSDFWTQTIYIKKEKFRNPIKQNWAHIYALKEVLFDYKRVTYHPIIVFAGNAELKNINSRIPVIYSRQILQLIKNEKGITNLSVGQVSAIASRLREINIKDRRAKREHAREVKKHVHERTRNLKSKICPRCGGALVLIKGKYGKFYGCSNFPKCRYR